MKVKKKNRFRFVNQEVTTLKKKYRFAEYRQKSELQPLEKLREFESDIDVGNLRFKMPADFKSGEYYIIGHNLNED